MRFLPGWATRRLADARSAGADRRAAYVEVRYGVDNLLTLPRGHARIERQAHDAVADPLGDGQHAGPSAQALAHPREVEGEVMEDGVDVEPLEMLDHRGTRLRRRHHHVEEV